MQLLTPIRLGSREARNRVVFGPHVTNLGEGRALSARHVAYYERRARGGAGVIVTEEAAVHPSDWSYERSPLASECGPGWEAVVEACRSHGTLVLAGLGHTGGQGTSHWSQGPMWAPSDEPEVNTREVPKIMEPADIRAVIDGFGTSAAAAMAAGCDGVEINAGQHSLVRQFLSGLTNRRDDRYGEDRLAFAREVIEAVRAASGDGVVALRLSCDELAPWAGLTPESAADVAVALAPLVDLLTVVKGSIFSVPDTRPDTHTATGFNLDLARDIRTAVDGTVPVAVQGSIVDVGQAEWALGDGRCDLVEMTRAQIADAELVAKAGTDPATIRPCLRCNQLCQVRDNRNPIVSCVVDPRSGHELDDPVPGAPAVRPHDVLVVGGGAAGLEAARTAAEAGHRVRLVEAGDTLGGMVRVAAAGAGREPLAAIVDWLEAEVRRLGVTVVTGERVDAAAIEGFDGSVVIATGSTAGPPAVAPAPGVTVLDAPEVLGAAADDRLDDVVPAGDVVLIDPVGGPIAVSLAELLAPLGHTVHLITGDHFAGQMLALTGDLAPANVRLARLGVNVVARSVVRGIGPDGVEVEQRFSGERHIIAGTVIDAGPRLPDAGPASTAAANHPRVGDAVAPRTIHEAILEARRAVAGLDRTRVAT